MPVFALLFVWCPLLGIGAYALWLTRQEETSLGRLWVLAVMLSLYLGFLGATKELLGDFLTYNQYFMEVPRHTLPSYLAMFGKEPLFYGFTYVAYWLFLGNWKLYVILLTAMNYLLLSYAILRVGLRLKSSIDNVVLALFFMTFFFQEFAAIGNMLRQGLAQSVTLVFLVRWHVDGKRSWWLALCALGIHTSCLPILGIGLLPVLHRKLTPLLMARLSLIVIGLGTCFFFMGDYLAHLPFIGYIFDRAGEGAKLLGADAWQTEVGLQPPMIALMALQAMMIFSIYRREEGTEFFVFANLTLILLLMMVVCEVFGMYYLQMRYFFYLYAFQNILFLCWLHGCILLKGEMSKQLLALCLMVYFFYELSHGMFRYVSVMEAIVYPLPMYI